LSSVAEEYRTNARECEQLAEESRDAQPKEEFLKIAQKVDAQLGPAKS
jgi:hypothetical protein